MDDGDLQDLYEIKSWRDMTDEDVIADYAALAFLSAPGFRYFIPAYLGYVLRNPESPQAVVESTIWAFDPPRHGYLEEFVASKLSTLDAKQHAAVEAFLEAMAPHLPDAAGALDYWRLREQPESL